MDEEPTSAPSARELIARARAAEQSPPPPAATPVDLDELAARIVERLRPEIAVELEALVRAQTALAETAKVVGGTARDVNRAASQHRQQLETVSARVAPIRWALVAAALTIGLLAGLLIPT